MLETLRNSLSSVLFYRRSTTQKQRWHRIVAGNRSMGVNLIGPVTALNGLGTSSRGYLQALQSAGVSLNVVQWRSGFEHVKEMPLETPSRPLQPINIVHLNMDYLSQGILGAQPLKSLVHMDRYNIAIFYWELLAVPGYWHKVIAAFDEIWCASSFVQKAISAITDHPVRLLRPAISPGKTAGSSMRVELGIPGTRFVFFYSADLNSIVDRKNPKAFLDAYLEEFSPEENAFCLVKIHCTDPDNTILQDIRNIADTRKDIMLIDQMLSDGQLADLYSSIDCYVSPHRSEGLGLTVIEAMMLGKPVIATPYGGVADFINSTTGYPLEFKLIEVSDRCWPYPEGYIWADPSIASIREMMRRTYDHPMEAEKRGLAGRDFVQDMFSRETTGRQIGEALEAIWSNCQLQAYKASIDSPTQ